jgi:stalled ribosome alternative rescue factor ArfA
LNWAFDALFHAKNGVFRRLFIIMRQEKKRKENGCRKRKKKAGNRDDLAISAPFFCLFLRVFYSCAKTTTGKIRLDLKFSAIRGFFFSFLFFFSFMMMMMSTTTKFWFLFFLFLEIIFFYIFHLLTLKTITVNF